jgi:hypothetical protein
MLCYPCTKRCDVERPAVALCRSCFAGLCAEHLREAAQAASENPLAVCHHGTWAAAGSNGAVAYLER